MKWQIAWMGLLAPLVLSGCQKESANQANADDSAYIETFSAAGQRIAPADLTAAGAQPSALTPGHHAFAFATFPATTDVNTITAPFEWQQFLSMVALGAAGTTLDAMADAARLDLQDAAVYPAVSAWEQQINALTAVERKHLLWGQQRYRFAGDYLQSQAELFGPEMLGVDFQADPAVAGAQINQTLGDTLTLAGIDQRTRLVAAHTSRITAAWSAATTVEPVRGRFAVLEDDEQRWVDMVRIRGTMNTASGADYRAVEIPLADPGLSLLMIIPAGGAYDDVRSRFDQAMFDALLPQLQPAATSIMVPLFSLSHVLSEAELPDLGVALIEPSSAAPDDTADFSRVNHLGYLSLMSPQQRITLATTADGLTAATATAVVHTASVDEPPVVWEGSSVTVSAGGGGGNYGIFGFTDYESPCFYSPDQRPFLFAVYARATSTLLHLGQVVTLEGPAVAPDWTTSTGSCGDSPPVEVYQYSGVLQCESDDGYSISTMYTTLVNAGVEVLSERTDQDGVMRIASCGADSGEINVFTIRESAVPLAEDLGFSRLSELTSYTR
ncbi:MAG: serpin family protein [Pseudomonadota bacterium]